MVREKYCSPTDLISGPAVKFIPVLTELNPTGVPKRFVETTPPSVSEVPTLKAGDPAEARVGAENIRYPRKRAVSGKDIVTPLESTRA